MSKSFFPRQKTARWTGKKALIGTLSKNDEECVRFMSPRLAFSEAPAQVVFSPFFLILEERNSRDKTLFSRTFRQRTKLDRKGTSYKEKQF